MPQIDVTFDIDANGILHVSAKDLGTGKEQKISITGSSGLSSDEVEKMREEAESHAEEDKQAKEAAEVRNNADMLAYQCEKQLNELGDKLPADKKKEVEEAINAVKEAVKGNDVDAMKSAHEKLEAKFQEVSAELYQQAAAQQAASQQTGPAPETGAEPEAESKEEKADVVDAEFEMVDDDKNKKEGD